MKRLLLAFQFLTIVPVRISGEVSEEDVGGSALFFPVVGAAQGLLLGGAALFFLKVFPPDITAGIAVLLHIALTGGFHMDGLSDTFDAFAVKSSGDAEADRQKMLAVMKDSATGAIGALSIVLAVLLKFLYIKNILAEPGGSMTPFSVLFLMPVLSKWAMIPLMSSGRPAREDGLGRAFIGGAKGNTALVSTLLTVVISLSASALLGLPLALPILSMVGLYIFGLGAIWLFERKFGGITGDNMGAVAEISEILFLSGAYIWLQRFIS